MLYSHGQNLTADETSWAAGSGAPSATVRAIYARALVFGGLVRSVTPDDTWFRPASLPRVSSKTGAERLTKIAKKIRLTRLGNTLRRSGGFGVPLGRA